MAGATDSPRMPYMTIVIPAYNEQNRLPNSLDLILDYLLSQEFASEIIVVDDGSTDRTYSLAHEFGETVGKRTDKVLFRVVCNAANVGKGFSVARGLELALGERVLFTDADLSAPIGEADKLASWLDRGYDVAIGSRRLPGSQVEPQPLHRRLMGTLFGLLTSLIVVRGYRDTQCGFKMYKARAAKAIAALQVMPGFVFDVEQLFLAKRLGLKVIEVPISWADDRETKVRILTDPLKMGIGLFKIRVVHSGLVREELE